MKFPNFLHTSLSLFLICIVAIGCGPSDNKTSEKPNADSAPIEAPSQPTLTQQKEYIKTNVPISSLNELSQGDSMNITNTIRNETYTLKIRSVRNTLPTVVSITANIEDRETGLATLSIKDNQLFGMLEFYKENLRYQVAYDSAAGQAYLVERPFENEDELEGGTPLESSEY
ncbi:hypothetical protein [Gracilimonas mengyeensis]|uniref:Lipoprotein n=1 Tax=Gracilimonas mengyeensis TaxID=1302730 RepID=A0A521CYN6_9BACT|nr:hypothetical protein [Gracilimonas mengyeensis]SMO63871.1 hypothetical protein SAMN06265219_106177 [Gracilimonas mengyeensis]